MAYSALIERLQREATEAGYNPGPIDGLFGRRTQAGLEAYVSATYNARINDLSMDQRIAFSAALADLRDGGGVPGEQTLAFIDRLNETPAPAHEQQATQQQPAPEAAGGATVRVERNNSVFASLTGEHEVVRLNEEPAATPATQTPATQTPATQTIGAPTPLVPETAAAAEAAAGVAVLNFAGAGVADVQRVMRDTFGQNPGAIDGIYGPMTCRGSRPVMYVDGGIIDQLQQLHTSGTTSVEVNGQRVNIQALAQQLNSRAVFDDLSNIRNGLSDQTVQAILTAGAVAEAAGLSQFPPTPAREDPNLTPRDLTFTAPAAEPEAPALPAPEDVTPCPILSDPRLADIRDTFRRDGFSDEQIVATWGEFYREAYTAASRSGHFTSPEQIEAFICEHAYAENSTVFGSQQSASVHVGLDCNEILSERGFSVGTQADVENGALVLDTNHGARACRNPQDRGNGPSRGGDGDAPGDGGPGSGPGDNNSGADPGDPGKGGPGDAPGDGGPGDNNSGADPGGPRASLETSPAKVQLAQLQQRLAQLEAHYGIAADGTGPAGPPLSAQAMPAPPRPPRSLA